MAEGERPQKRAQRRGRHDPKRQHPPGRPLTATGDRVLAGEPGAAVVAMVTAAARAAGPAALGAPRRRARRPELEPPARRPPVRPAPTRPVTEAPPVPEPDVIVEPAP